jgi:hypothetical protein
MKARGTLAVTFFAAVAGCRSPARAPANSSAPNAPSAEVSATVPADPRAPGDAAGSAAAAGGGADYPIHGSLVSGYRGRWTKGDHDNDLREVLSLDLGDPDRNPWTGHVMTRLDADLDGKHPGTPSPFHDLDDTYDGAVSAHLYDAWMQRNDVGSLAWVRLGRQTLWDTPVFAWFDGVGAETKDLGSKRWKLGAFAGVPVHLYENSHGGDLLGGAYAEVHPWTAGRARLDAMHIEDEGELGAHSNDLFHLSLSQSIGARLRLDGGWTRLENDDRDVSASLTWWDPDADFSARLGYFQLLTTQESLVPELDPYFATLFELFPYRQGQLLLSKGLGKYLNLQAGADVRRVTEDADEGTFNRDFERTFGTLTVHDPGAAGTSASVTGEVWNSDGSDITTWGLDVSQPIGRRITTSVGSVYSLYKVDDLTGTERDHVRTYYARFRWGVATALTWELRMELEDIEPDPIEDVRMGLSWRF